MNRHKMRLYTPAIIPVAAGLCIVGVSAVLMSILVPSYSGFSLKMTDPTTNIEAATVDFAGRMLWLVCATALTTSVVVVAGLSIAVLVRFLRVFSPRTRIALITVAAALSAASTYWFGFVNVAGFANVHLLSDMFPGMFETTEHLEIARAIAHALTGGVLGAVLLLLFALWSILAFEMKEEAGEKARGQYLASQIKWILWLLYTAAACLVAGVLEVFALYRWPASLSDEPEKLQSVAGVISASYGGVWVLLLVSIYLPVTSLLREKMHALAESAPCASDNERSELLTRYGLSTTPRQRLTRLAVIMSPLLVGLIDGPAMRLLDSMMKN